MIMYLLTICFIIIFLIYLISLLHKRKKICIVMSYTDNIKSYYKQLNVDINKMKPNQILVYPKIFLYPSGGSSSEVFLFSDII
jgi:hypothetical protein